MRPYLTKVWFGAHWRYIHTRRKYRLRVVWKFGVISYIRRKEVSEMSEEETRTDAPEPAAGTEGGEETTPGAGAVAPDQPEGDQPAGEGNDSE